MCWYSSGTWFRNHFKNQQQDRRHKKVKHWCEREEKLLIIKFDIFLKDPKELCSHVLSYEQLKKWKLNFLTISQNPEARETIRGQNAWSTANKTTYNTSGTKLLKVWIMCCKAHLSEFLCPDQSFHKSGVRDDIRINSLWQKPKKKEIQLWHA